MRLSVASCWRACHASRSLASAWAWASSAQRFARLNAARRLSMNWAGSWRWSSLGSLAPSRSTRGGCEAFPQRGAALVGLYDGVDLGDTFQVAGPLVFPAGGAGDAQGLYAVMPEGVAVALALD